MKTIRMLLALMAILMCNAMVNAKLTMAYVQKEEKVDVNIQYVAKIRQALIEIYGEEWFKESLKEWFKNGTNLLSTYMGQDKELILQGRKMWDENLLLKVKSAYDLLSIKGDTLYRKKISLTCQSIIEDSPGGSNLLEVLEREMTNRLLVGRLYKEDVELDFEYFGILANNLGEEYEKECKDKGHLSLIVYYKIDPEDIGDEDIDFYFESLMKADKELLKQKVTSKAFVRKFSYEYDERAEVRYIHENRHHINELPFVFEKEDADEKPKLDEERENK